MGRTRFYAAGLLRKVALRFRDDIEQIVDASGGSVFRNLIRPAMLEWIRAAALTQPLRCYSLQNRER
jgi:hypothetical protein